MDKITAQKLTAKAFSDFGEVIEKPGSKSFLINNGHCRRHHALALADVTGEGAKVGISIFAGQPYDLPFTLNLMERHPLGSQAFYPLGHHPWLVMVAKDKNGIPDTPIAFLAQADQGINLGRGVWHGVLTPLVEASDFLVVDRIGDGNNLEEHHLGSPFQVLAKI